LLSNEDSMVIKLQFNDCVHEIATISKLNTKH